MASDGGVIDSLLVSLGYDYDRSGGDDFEESLDNIQKKASMLVTALVAGAAAIYGLTAATTRGVDSQGKLSSVVSESVEDIDALSHALRISGDDAGAVDQILTGLSSTISEASKGMGAGVEVFGRLGISATKSSGELKGSIEMLLEISDALAALSDQEQLELSRKLGLEPSLKLMRQGSDGMMALIRDAKELGVVTGEDAMIAADFQDGLARMSRMFGHLSVVITRALAPVLDDVVGKFVAWWKVNRDVIEQNVAHYIERASGAMSGLVEGAKALAAVGLSAVLLRFLMAIRKVSVGLLVMKSIMFAIPVAVASLVAAVGILWNEAERFFDGRPNIFSDMIKDSPALESALVPIVAALKTMGELIRMAYNGWKDLIGLFTSDTTLGEHVDNLKNMALDIVGEGPLTNPLGEKRGFFDGPMFSFAEGMFGLDGRKDGTTPSNTAAPLPSAVGIIRREETNIDVGGITINGAAAPKEVADEVNRMLLREKSALATNQRS